VLPNKSGWGAEARDRERAGGSVECLIKAGTYLEILQEDRGITTGLRKPHPTLGNSIRYRPPNASQVMYDFIYIL